MPTVTMSMEEYLALVQGVEVMSNMPSDEIRSPEDPKPAKRKTSSSKYGRTYKKEFRRIAPRFKMKNGKWKKGGFRSAVKAAHRATKKILG